MHVRIGEERGCTQAEQLEQLAVAALEQLSRLGRRNAEHEPERVQVDAVEREAASCSATQGLAASTDVCRNVPLPSEA